MEQPPEARGGASGPRPARRAGGPAQTAAAGVLGTLVSVALLYAVLRKTDWPEVGRLLVRANVAWLLLGTVGIAVAVVSRALMWRVLLLPTGPVGVRTVARALIMGLTVNNVLPARMGEPFRAAIVATESRRSLVAVVATVLAETLSSGLLLVGIGALALFHAGSLPWFSRVALPLVLASLLILVGLSVLARRPAPEGAGRLRSLLLRVRAGGLALARPWAVAQIVTFGTCAIAGQMLLLLGVVRALGGSLSLAGIALTVVAMNLAGALPSAPAAVGTLEFGAMGALALFSVPRALAVSITLLFHVLITGTVTVLGVVLLSRAGVRLGHMGATVAQRVREAFAGPQ